MLLKTLVLLKHIQTSDSKMDTHIAKLTFVRLISEWSLGGCEDPQGRAGLSRLRI